MPFSRGGPRCRVRRNLRYCVPRHDDDFEAVQAGSALLCVDLRQGAFLLLQQCNVRVHFWHSPALVLHFQQQLHVGSYGEGESRSAGADRVHGERWRSATMPCIRWLEKPSSCSPALSAIKLCPARRKRVISFPGQCKQDGHREHRLWEVWHFPVEPVQHGDADSLGQC